MESEFDFDWEGSRPDNFPFFKHVVAGTSLPLPCDFRAQAPQQA